MLRQSHWDSIFMYDAIGWMGSGWKRSRVGRTVSDKQEENTMGAEVVRDGR